MKKPCQRCGRLLEAIDAHQNAYGYAATLRELGDAAGISTTSIVVLHIDEHLAPAGVLVRDPGIARSVRRVRAVV